MLKNRQIMPFSSDYAPLNGPVMSFGNFEYTFRFSEQAFDAVPHD